MHVCVFIYHLHTFLYLYAHNKITFKTRYTFNKKTLKRITFKEANKNVSNKTQCNVINIARLHRFILSL